MSKFKVVFVQEFTTEVEVEAKDMNDAALTVLNDENNKFGVNVSCVSGKSFGEFRGIESVEKVD